MPATKNMFLKQKTKRTFCFALFFWGSPVLSPGCPFLSIVAGHGDRSPPSAWEVEPGSFQVQG